MNLLRLYEPHECGSDGYPVAWHKCPTCEGAGTWRQPRGGYGPQDPEIQILEGKIHHCPDCEGAGSVKNLVRQQAGYRCVRCHHPYRPGKHGDGEWSPCDSLCKHGGPLRVAHPCDQVPGLDGNSEATVWTEVEGTPREWGPYCPTEAQWRILTVHHLTGEKADCRWFNLVPLCQRDHLEIQARVHMQCPWPWEHSEWMKPYVAAWYAWKYRGEDLTRTETMARLNELLEMGKSEEAVERMPI